MELLNRKGCEDGVHRFKPRYSIVAPNWFDHIERMRGVNPKDFYETIYECDVCIRCGKIVRRDL